MRLTVPRLPQAAQGFVSANTTSRRPPQPRQYRFLLPSSARELSYVVVSSDPGLCSATAPPSRLLAAIASPPSIAGQDAPDLRSADAVLTAQCRLVLDSLRVLAKRLGLRTVDFGPTVFLAYCEPALVSGV